MLLINGFGLSDSYPIALCKMTVVSSAAKKLISGGIVSSISAPTGSGKSRSIVS